MVHNNDEHYKTDMYPIPDKISLYQVARWYAFKEKPLDYNIATLLYPYYLSADFPHVTEEGCYADSEYPSFVDYYERGCKETLAMVLAGHIPTFGNRTFYVGGIEENILKDDSEFIEICKYEYTSFVSSQDHHDPVMFWYSGGYKCNTFFFDRPFYLSDIHIKKEDFILLSKLKENKPQTGRPTKYDWESFYIAITLIANSLDGLPDKQADLEAEMMQWCIDNNWPDTPAQSMIRKKISPIYQALKKDKK